MKMKRLRKTKRLKEIIERAKGLRIKLPKNPQYSWHIFVPVYVTNYNNLREK